MRVIGYTRLSRASREESTSIERQRSLIRQTCAARGFTLVDTVDDIDVSASRSRLDRPGLDEVRERIRSGEADAVMVWRLDRVARSVVDFGTLLDEGLDIISATEPLDTTTPMGRAMAEVLQVFAALEAKTIGLRVSASQAHLREKTTRWPGGVLPYGYRVVPHPDGVGKALEPDPHEAAVVRRMADSILGGASVYATTQALNDDGVKPRRAARWEPSSVQRIVRSDSVLGRVKSRGALVRDDDGLPVVRWEPILSVEEVDRLRALTEWGSKTGRTASTRRRASRLLSGLLSCESCGSALVVRYRSGRNAIYGCGLKARGGACKRGTVVECERVEAEVERRFLDALGIFPVVEQVVTTRDVPGLAEVEQALRETADEMTRPDADVAALVERLNALRVRRESLEAIPVAPETRLVETGQSFAERWAVEDVAGRRALLRSAGVEVTLGPGQKGRWRPERVQMTVHGAPLGP